MKKLVVIPVSVLVVISIAVLAILMLVKNNADNPTNRISDPLPNTSQNQTNQTAGPTNNLDLQPSNIEDANLQECLDRVSRLEANDTIIKQAQDDCYDKFR